MKHYFLRWEALGLPGITPVQSHVLFPLLPAGSRTSSRPLPPSEPPAGNPYTDSPAQKQAAANAALTAALGTSATPAVPRVQPQLQLPGLSVANTIYTLLTGEAAPSELSSQGVGALISTQG